MTDDRMAEIKVEVAAKYAVFDAKRRKLIEAYRKAQTPKTRLKALAKVARHHHAYMSSNILLGGWMTDEYLRYAEAMEKIAEEL